MGAIALPVKPIAPMGRSYGRRHVMEPGVGRMTPTYERKNAVPRLPSGRTQPRYMPAVLKDIPTLPARCSELAPPHPPSQGPTRRTTYAAADRNVLTCYSTHHAPQP